MQKKSMSKWGLLGLIVLLVMLGTLYLVNADPNIVTFEDDRIRAILVSSGYDTDHDDQISYDEIKAVQQLNLNYVNSIVGLQYATNLKNLSISNASLSDLSSLATLNLSSLTLQNCYYGSDYSALGNMTSMQTLRIEPYNADTLSILQNMSQLKALVLSDYHGSDFSALTSLVALNTLELNNFSQMNSVSFLQYTNQLQSLTLGSCSALSDLSSVVSLINLKHLKISNCSEIVNYSALSSLSGLITLKIESCPGLTDLLFMSGMTQLLVADLPNNKITSLSGIENNVNLVTLDISNNNITSINNIVNLVNVCELNISLNKIVSISVLSEMINSNLSVINLSNNVIQDLSPLLNLACLHEVLLGFEYDQYLDDNLAVIYQLRRDDIEIYLAPKLPYQYQVLVKDQGLTTTCMEGEIAGQIGTPIVGFGIYDVSSYTAYISGLGWTYRHEKGDILDTYGRNIEAIRIRGYSWNLYRYQLYYRVYVSSYGWMGWAKSGETAGSIGLGLPIEAIELRAAKSFDELPLSDHEKAFIHQTVLQHKITFDSRGGSSVLAQIITEGSLIQQPANPTKPGYVFSGWYRDISLQDPWNFSIDTVTTTMTLYARWSLATTPENSIISDPATGISLTFDSVLSSGVTTIQPLVSPAPDSVYYIENHLAYYEITTTASFSDSVLIGIPYNPLLVGGQEYDLRLYRFVDGLPEDITDHVDLTEKIIYGKIIDHFCVFAVAEVPQINNQCSIITVKEPIGVVINGTDLSLQVGKDIKSISINLIVSEGATWDIYADASMKNKLSNTDIKLQNNRTVLYIQVTAQNKQSSQTYTLTIDKV